MSNQTNHRVTASLTELYRSATGEDAPAEDIARELSRQNSRRRRIVAWKLAGKPYSAIAGHLGITKGSVRSSILLTMRGIRKRLLALPRYHEHGHPGPPAAARAKRWAPKPKKRKPGPGRPRSTDRCPCGKLTRARAAARGHRCSSKE